MARIVDILKLQHELSVAKQIERLAVIGRDSVQADGFPVFTGGIAFVAEPVVKWVFLSQVIHVVVPERLGQDAGGCDGEVFAVALDDGGVRQVAVGLETVAVDDDGFRPKGELVECPVHGEDGGVEDVDVVYLLGRNDADTPGQGIAQNLFAELVAPLFRELLGVIQPLVVIIGGENDGGGEDAAGKTSSAGFIATGFGQSFVVMAFEHGMMDGWCGFHRLEHLAHSPDACHKGVNLFFRIIDIKTCTHC